MKYRSTKAILLFAVAFAGAGFVARDPLLRSVGHLMTADDGLEPADAAIATAEAGSAGELELADLVDRHLVGRVAVLIPDPSPGSLELRRRGIVTEDPRGTLTALGVRPDTIALIPANEGGTSDGAEALVAWCQAERIRRLIVVTNADHVRRLRRVLSRSFEPGGTRVRVHSVQYGAFRASDWWQNRRTLRSGIIELQKLLLDYVRHPL